MSAPQKIGVLALQGDFAEHINMLAKLGVKTLEVKLPKHLNAIDGLIIPGGESTTISRLIHEWNLHQPILDFVKRGMGIWGTCAGAILLAKNVKNLHPKGLEIMDIEIKRNAFGRQIDSFSIDLKFPPLGKKPFQAVFIRAPIITKIGQGVEKLISLHDDTIVAARQNKLLATSFHPELTNDSRFHKYFLDILK